MDCLNRLKGNWDKCGKVIVYGWGKYGKKLIHTIQKDFDVVCIIDNDNQKNGKNYQDIPIVSLDDATLYIKKKYKIIVMTHLKAYYSIADVLKKVGLKENEDFCRMEQFIVEWYWKYRNQINIFELHTSITTRCTLKCQNCNMFMPYYKQAEDFTMDEIRKQFDLLFSRIDYIYNYEILGGEPFLNQDFFSILYYLKKNYGNRIGTIGIITNGTIVLSSKILEWMKTEKINITISDYTNRVKYAEKLSELIKLLKEYDISYKILKNLEWLDFGFPEKPKNYQNIEEHMRLCGPVFHGYNDEKLYYCHIAWSAEKCGLIELKASDFVDLKDINPEKKADRQRLAEYILGYWPEGFVSMCQKCAGCGIDNRESIPVGIQRD